MPAKIGYSYIRFSTVEQAKGQSLVRQLEATRLWCSRNGVVLDESTSLRDLGVSGFTGAHRHEDNADKFALAAFLRMIEEGRVAEDSYLIIENLDRLSREHVKAATRLFLSIQEAGVNIVTTSPERIFLHDSNDMTDLIIAVVELSRGHGESQRKSDIIGHAWRKRKERSVEKKIPVTAQCPRWLRVVGDRYVERPDCVEVVRRIYRECISGMGPYLIAKTLNKEKVPSFNKDQTEAWAESTVKRILTNRSVLGEYQPHVGNKKRQKVGEPVKDFYPAIIGETDFLVANGAIKKRSKYGGKSHNKAVNLFTSLVFDAVDGTHWSVHGCGKMTDGSAAKFMSNGEAVTKGIAKRKSVPYRVFEKAMLDFINGITAADLLPPEKASEGNKLEDLNKKVMAVSLQIEELQRNIEEDGDFKAGLELLRRLQKKKEQVIAEYEKMKRELATPVVDALSQSVTLIQLLETAEDKDMVRGKLRAKIANVVKAIEVYYHQEADHHYSRRKLLCKITHHNSEYTRCVEIDYRPFHIRSNRPEIFQVRWAGDFKGGVVWIDHYLKGAPLPW